VVTGRWLVGPAALPERLLAAVAAVLLLYLEPTTVLIGLTALVLAVVVHLLGRRRRPTPPDPAAPSPLTPTQEITP
jgi:TRAP-type uncharacterized transport system fused permease subunit